MLITDLDTLELALDRESALSGSAGVSNVLSSYKSGFLNLEVDGQTIYSKDLSTIDGSARESLVAPSGEPVTVDIAKDGSATTSTFSIGDGSSMFVKSRFVNTH